MTRFAFYVLVVLSSIAAIHVVDAADNEAPYEAQLMTTKTGGTLAADEVWTAAASPYQLTGSLSPSPTSAR